MLSARRWFAHIQSISDDTAATWYMVKKLTVSIQCFRQCHPGGLSYQAVAQLRAVFERFAGSVGLTAAVPVWLTAKY